MRGTSATYQAACMYTQRLRCTGFGLLQGTWRWRPVLLTCCAHMMKFTRDVLNDAFEPRESSGLLKDRGGRLRTAADD